jgi:hypothetical protein
MAGVYSMIAKPVIPKGPKKIEYYDDKFRKLTEKALDKAKEKTDDIKRIIENDKAKAPKQNEKYVVVEYENGVRVMEAVNGK